jgi:aminotransferase EvaB
VNFLPGQYQTDSKFLIKHNYLEQQFLDHEEILYKIKNVVLNGDFTLGKAVDDFEDNFKNLIGTKFAIGVGSGTDALMLSLKCLELSIDDEVITTPYTFYATVGAIVTANLKPVFVDIGEDYNMDVDKIEQKITARTKVILPVHWAGLPNDMDKIYKIATKYNLVVIEDACHAIKATYRNKYAGGLGDIGCFSFHPLKNLNVWGDGGIITTNSKNYAYKIKLLRNHGLISRDICEIFAFNSRLDTIQAVVAQHMLLKIDSITSKRMENANYLSKSLKKNKNIKTPIVSSDKQNVYHLYVIRAKQRDKLQEFLIQKGIDAKVHYPIPMHLQPAAAKYGYKSGDFPETEKIIDEILSLPVHEYVTQEDLDFMVDSINDFYLTKS